MTILPLVAALIFSACASGAPLAGAEQQQVIDRVAQELRAKYVFPEMGSRLADGLLDKQRRGGYSKVTDPQEFAKALTAEIQEISKDRHLRVFYNDPGSNGGSGGPRFPPVQMTPVDEPKRLEGNIGYINIHGFPGPDAFGVPFQHAMNELAGTNAIIIDLRNNGGGSPDSVMLAAGYFIPKRTLVARIFSRLDGSTTEMWTKEVAGPHYEKPLYILTSRRTFSAAEAMAYHMKAPGRAIIVGEASGGGAHRIMPVDVGNNFVLAVAFTRPTNVITGSDWEGTGVIPDIASSAESALDTALADAKKRTRRP